MLKFGKKKKGDAAEADANLPAVTEGSEGGEGAEGDAAPKKKKLPLLFIIAPVALLVVGGGGAAAFFMFMKPPAEAHAEEGADGHGKKAEKPKKEKGGGGHGAKGGEADPSLGKITEGPDGVVFWTMPDLVTNIQTADGRPTHLKLKLTLGMKSHELAEHLQAESPRLKDMFQGFLREIRPEELNGSTGTFQLRAEILRRVNLIAAPETVDEVLIEEMLVQ